MVPIRDVISLSWTACTALALFSLKLLRRGGSQLAFGAAAFLLALVFILGLGGLVVTWFLFQRGQLNGCFDTSRKQKPTTGTWERLRLPGISAATAMRSGKLWTATSCGSSALSGELLEMIGTDAPSSGGWSFKHEGRRTSTSSSPTSCPGLNRPRLGRELVSESGSVRALKSTSSCKRVPGLRNCAEVGGPHALMPGSTQEKPSKNRFLKVSRGTAGSGVCVA